MRLERDPQAPKQHGHVGALGAVVGVELVEHEIGERLGRLLPDPLVLGAQQQLVEHLVVGEQDVGSLAPDDRPVGDQAGGHAVDGIGWRDDGVFGPGLAGVERRRDGGLGAVPRDVVGRQHGGESLGLIVGQGIHGVEDQCLHPCDALAALLQAVVKDRQQECLGLARPGSGRDERWLRSALPRAQPAECPRLVVVGWPVVELPIEQHTAARRLRERHRGLEIGALEHSVDVVVEEVSKRLARRGVCERECGGEEVEQAVMEAQCLPGRQ